MIVNMRRAAQRKEQKSKIATWVPYDIVAGYTNFKVEFVARNRESCQTYLCGQQLNRIRLIYFL